MWHTREKSARIGNACHSVIASLRRHPLRNHHNRCNIHIMTLNLILNLAGFLLFIVAPAIALLRR